jgi:hypothetical protein
LIAIEITELPALCIVDVRIGFYIQPRAFIRTVSGDYAPAVIGVNPDWRWIKRSVSFGASDTLKPVSYELVCIPIHPNRTVTRQFIHAVYFP